MSKPRTFEGPRGLNGYITFDTFDNENVQLQDSSAAVSYCGDQELDGPFYWLRVDGASAHIHHTEARALRDALNVALGDENTPITIQEGQ